MNEQEIITILTLVGDELQAIGLRRPIRLLLIGGAYMLTQIHNRPSTRDVDVIVVEPEITSEDYRIFKQAVQFVAHDRGISAAWLSDNIAQFLQSTGDVPVGTLWLSHGMLEVSIPDAGYILATKVLAGRDRDVPDIEALLDRLGITSRQQVEELLTIYLSPQTRRDYGADLQLMLDTLFPD